MVVSPSPRAFVAGATGYVGQALVAELSERDIPVIAHVRPDSERLAAWRARFELPGVELSTAAWSAGDMAAEFERRAPSHVFCLIGTTRKRARSAPESAGYDAVDFGLTTLLLAAAAAQGSKPRFVYLSSLGTSAKARGAYLRTRWRTEEAVRASGLPFTIARPSLITGPDREELRPAEWLGARLLGWPLSALGLVRGANFVARYRPLDAAELARGLVRAAFNYTTIDRVLETGELRDEAANDREGWAPRSHRDTERFS